MENTSGCSKTCKKKREGKIPSNILSRLKVEKESGITGEKDTTKPENVAKEKIDLSVYKDSMSTLIKVILCEN